MDYDSAQRRHIKCQRLVVLLWSNRFISIPVAFAFWHHRDFVKTYRTKNEIARILIYWTVRHGIGFSYLTFDNWYASKQNLRFFNRLGLRFVTRLRKNTWIIHEGKKKKVTDLNWYECHRYSALKAYVRQFDVDYPRFGTGSLALVKHDKHAEPGRTKYLFTNDLSLTNQELVGRYRSRWEIEIFFRTCKQSFALSACQAQMMPQVILHIRMVLLRLHTDSAVDWRRLNVNRTDANIPAFIALAKTPRPTRSVGLYASRWNFNPGFIGDLDGTNWDKAFRASARSNSHDSRIYDSCVAPTH